MSKTVSTKALKTTSFVIFTIFTIWWLVLLVTGKQGTNSIAAEDFGYTYGIMALFGGIVGLRVSNKWGGFKSLIGKATGFISLGLLAQEFGQIAYSYLGSKMEEVPYPSVGDIGYFGSVVLYIIGLLYLIKALKTKDSVKATKNKLSVVLLPMVLLAGSYFLFLRDYQLDSGNMLATMLDFGYPLGQAFYFALAILTFTLSRKYLGGIMKPVISFLIVALLIQYASDFTFLYMTNKDLWETAGINDYMYLVSYFVMTISLLSFGKIVEQLNAGVDKTISKNPAPSESGSE